MPLRKDLKSVLIIGSGPIVIGQACEFDYSGVQAVKALKEEGLRVILVNPNPATVMTTPGLADAIYMDPLETLYLEQIIRREKPGALLPTMGGQTALNLALDLDREGILARHGIEVIGAGIQSIRLAEDRGLFKELCQREGLDVPRSAVAGDMAGAERIKNEIGLPVIIRPSYTLGGKGGSIAATEEEFRLLMPRALRESPAGEALIEESLLGWKEFELEVMRDRGDNAVVICSIENIDPMGVHTGDSITVAPIQTLSDREYQPMRDQAIRILRAVGVDCGGSNVQFALNPATGRMVIIEMNPRVSRSSALASKATGFPIARCSAKLAVGYTLDEIINEITGKTASCFEPALDYCAVKMPRFELEKFPQGYGELSTQMKSVGESLALGRTFPEALNKAIRAAEMGAEGLEELPPSRLGDPDLALDTRHPLRIFALYGALKKQGRPGVPELSRRTGYDPWVLEELLRQIELEARLAPPGEGPAPLDRELILEAKRLGLSDSRLAALLGRPAGEIARFREEKGILSVYHFVDTCAGEFSARTPYFYSTYGEIDEGEPLGDQGALILGSGPNRIGQGLEFDTCCTLASLAFRRRGVKTILVNSNPETVSTDFNVSDRLYIEPVDLEHVRDIIRKEGVRKVVVQMGGQLPLNIARQLEEGGAEILGTGVSSIFDVEDRSLFSRLLKRLNLRQPDNRMAFDSGNLSALAEDLGYPILLRPSFVLGGRSMFVAYKPEDINTFLATGIKAGPGRPILVDRFLEDAFEYDLDAISDGENVYIGGIMEHIEAAGVHSGDSACVFPPYKCRPEIQEEMEQAAVLLARELGIRGFINIQFAVKDGRLYILEVNPRASRTIPFISKTSGVNLIDKVVQIWTNRNLEEQGLTQKGFGRGRCVVGWAVKEAVFSFDRFTGMDPVLGPEMKSTGEVIGIGGSFGEAFLKAQEAAGTRLPRSGKVCVSVNKYDRATILPTVKKLAALGFQIAATPGTAEFLFEKGVLADVVQKVGARHPHVADHLAGRRIDFLINTPLGRFAYQGDNRIRIEAIKNQIPYTTTTSAAEAAAEGIEYLIHGQPGAALLPDSTWESRD
ncbi:MAG: carbamoyl-phosphate synthase large subunit [Spirochaetales bacterium]|jgi:carbamoyl-phosphate synthase large subunit|nr:carbamoyl-phosphate synthase large subunit [Spirochaetales bacterium]